jgi:protein-disulfide isomerase
MLSSLPNRPLFPMMNHPPCRERPFMIARRSLSRVVFLLAAVFTMSGARADDAMTTAQRDSIERVIHDYILAHPEVVIESLQSAEDRGRADADERSRKAVAARRQDLQGDTTSPIAGNPKGDVTIVEFFDYRCPYCKQVEPAIDALLREDGRIRLVYKEFPVLGPDSVYASRAALASRKQGKYGKFHDAMMAQKGTLDASVVMQLAAAAGLDIDKLKADMGSPDIEAVIKRNYALAQALEIHGTPAFVIGDEMVPGAIDIAALRQKIATARKS